MADTTSVNQLMEFLTELATDHAKVRRQLQAEKQVVGLLYSIMLQRFPETAAMLDVTRTLVQQSAEADPNLQQSADNIVARIDELITLKGSTFKPSVH